jgi:hypothetical protein
VKAKIKEMIDTNPSGNYPIIANNDESAILKWTGYCALHIAIHCSKGTGFQGAGTRNFLYTESYQLERSAY